MSPHVGNFVQDLVEMAKATEMLPQIQSQLTEARMQIEELQATVQRLELKLLDRSNTIDDLNRKVRDAEVARDDAEYRFLEAEDRTARAVDFIKATFGSAGALIQALEPPREEPMPMPEPNPVPEPLPTPSAIETELSTLLTPAPGPIISGTTNIDSQSVVQDQSASDPSVDTTTTQPNAGPGPVTTEDAGSTQTEHSPDNSQRYSGKRYSEVFDSGHYPSRDEWFDGGGDTDGWFS